MLEDPASRKSYSSIVVQPHVEERLMSMNIICLIVPECDITTPEVLPSYEHMFLLVFFLFNRF